MAKRNLLLEYSEELAVKIVKLCSLYGIAHRAHGISCQAEWIQPSGCIHRKARGARGCIGQKFQLIGANCKNIWNVIDFFWNI